MASTVFVNSVTPVDATWLNDVNDYVYTGNQGTVTATSGQTTFIVPFSRSTGVKLNVYINGVKQILGSSYTEATTGTVVFSEAVPVNAVVEFES